MYPDLFELKKIKFNRFKLKLNTVFLISNKITNKIDKNSI